MSPQNTSLGRIGGLINPRTGSNTNIRTFSDGIYRPEDNANVSNYKYNLNSYNFQGPNFTSIQLSNINNQDPGIPLEDVSALNILQYAGVISSIDHKDNPSLYGKRFFFQFMTRSSSSNSSLYRQIILQLDYSSSFRSIKNVVPSFTLLSYLSNISVISSTPYPNYFHTYGFEVAPGGNDAYVMVSDPTPYIEKFHLNTPYSLGGGGYRVQSSTNNYSWYDLNSQTTTSISGIPSNNRAGKSFKFGDNFNKFYVLDNYSVLYQYNLSSRGEISTSTVTYSNNRLVMYSTYDEDMRDFTFSGNGKYLYVCGNEHQKIYQFELSTPWDLSTASFYDDLHVGYHMGNGANINGLYMDQKGMSLCTFSALNYNARNLNSTASEPFRFVYEGSDRFLPQNIDTAVSTGTLTYTDNNMILSFFPLKVT